MSIRGQPGPDCRRDSGARRYHFAPPGAPPTEGHVPLLRSLFQQEAIKRGILTHGNHMLSLSHTEEVIEATLAIYAEVFAVLAGAVATGQVEQRLEGPPMQVVIRQL